MTLARARWAAALALSSAASTSAHADRVTVKGTTLEGTVLSLNAKTVELKTIYGDGTLKLKLSDVTAIETDGVFRVYHGDSVATGRAIAVEEKRLQVGEALGQGDSVAASELVAVQNERPGAGGLFDRLALAYPFWSGSFDLSLNYVDATVNSTSFATGVNLRRSKAPTRFLLGVTYSRSTSEDELGDDDVLANELRGFARFEYDLTPRLFAFGSLEAEHDQVERLSLRGIPKAGFGYKLWERPEKTFLAVDAGAAWVYERFFGGERNDYFGAAFGAAWAYELPYGALWAARLEYVPSVEDWAQDFILRAETSLLFPLSRRFALKTSLVDLYDSTPAEDLESNSFQTLVGVSLSF